MPSSTPPPIPSASPSCPPPFAYKRASPSRQSTSLAIFLSHPLSSSPKETQREHKPTASSSPGHQATPLRTLRLPGRTSELLSSPLASLQVLEPTLLFPSLNFEIHRRKPGGAILFLGSGLKHRRQRHRRTEERPINSSQPECRLGSLIHHQPPSRAPLHLSDPATDDLLAPPSAYVAGPNPATLAPSEHTAGRRIQSPPPPAISAIASPPRSSLRLSGPVFAFCGRRRPPIRRRPAPLQAAPCLPVFF